MTIIVVVVVVVCGVVLVVIVGSIYMVLLRIKSIERVCNTRRRDVL